ncbi:IS66 family transposase [Bordetella petrii]|uniref:IS66 family transposase n=1 Tax=Bordetella petrii TaxID=94624 RepID=UPI003AFA040E
MQAQRARVPDGSATAKAFVYSFKRWVALTRYLDDGKFPIDNNFIEQRIRPIAVGRSNWLFTESFTGSQTSGCRDDARAIGGIDRP